ncbi:toxin-antitoxin system, antitoxin component [Halobacteriales archaeon QH_7_65_31]|nr:MAG: toxin-antitoxin system, antitoxin component [Halobacteriales archaeon QH_7_65_31]PSQ31167.1 MAG: toxin-antitoxin system, antitoxin component [Halobacteriales archaeon SW_6_65_46]
MDEEPAAEIETARTALADARLLLDHGGSTEGVVNRLYYACFHAARAALYSRGEQPRSHGGVRTQFGQVVVLAGDAPREHGKLLRDLSDYRSVAEYASRTPAVDTRPLLADAEQFVDHAVSLVE